MTKWCDYRSCTDHTAQVITHKIGNKFLKYSMYLALKRVIVRDVSLVFQVLTFFFQLRDGIFLVFQSILEDFHLIQLVVYSVKVSSGWCLVVQVLFQLCQLTSNNTKVSLNKKRSRIKVSIFSTSYETKNSPRARVFDVVSKIGK